MDFWEPALVIAVFALAGFVKGVISLGLPTVAIGILGLWIPHAEAAALLVVPAFLTNIWQTFGGPHLVETWRRLWPMIIVLALVAVLATAIISNSDNAITLGFLGLMLVLFSVLDLSGIRLRSVRRSEPTFGIVTGASTGLITGATAVFVIPSVMYLQTLDLNKEQFTQAIGMTALTASCGLAIGLAIHGQFGVANIALPGVLSTVAAFSGMAFGRALQRRLSIDLFRRLVLYGLIGLGLVMILRTLNILE